MSYTYFLQGRQGARPSNQDLVAFRETEHAALLVACDGMGGHQNGDIASRVVAEYLCAAFDWAAKRPLTDPAKFLRSAVTQANQELQHHAAVAGLRETPRTTCVAAIVQNGKAWWAHVGDSRLYLIRGGKTAKRTIDHSQVQRMVDAGAITPEQALVHPERNKIFSCLGQERPSRVDFAGPVVLSSGDTLILVTDGVWGPLSERDLASIGGGWPLGVALPMMLDLAESLAGAQADNLSAVALRWFAEEAPIEEYDTIERPRPDHLVSPRDAAASAALLRKAARARRDSRLAQAPTTASRA